MRWTSAWGRSRDTPRAGSSPCAPCSARSDLWILGPAEPAGADGQGHEHLLRATQAGLPGHTLLASVRSGGGTASTVVDVVAVLPEGQSATLLTTPDGQVIDSSMSDPISGSNLDTVSSGEGARETGLVVHHYVVEMPTDVGPDGVRGLDLDGDGEPDVTLAHRG